MKLQLQAKPEEIKDKFASLKTRADVADLLEIKDVFLCKILYGIKERKKYTIFEIQKKSSRKREISSPPKNIAILQSKLNFIFKLLYKRKYCVHGFTEGKNIKSNAEKHASHLHLINIDLEDFFPSIHLWRIRGSLMSKPFMLGYVPANVIAQICCRDDGILPQGGVTSPIISNIICGPLDNDLMSFARKKRSYYTRYADDITFSTSSFHLPEKIAILENGKITLGDELISIINKHNFKINFSKVRYACPTLRQDVTGLTVNEFPNIQRSYIRTITGALNAWEKHGYPMASRKYLRKYRQRYNSGIDLDNVLQGKIAFVKMVLGKNSPIFRKLAKRYNKQSQSKISIVPVHELEPYPLRGNPPKSQAWKKWFKKYENSILLLEANNNGETVSGTAFCIGKDIYGTAGHNLVYNNTKLYFGETPKPIDEFTKYEKDSIDVGVIKQLENGCPELAWIPTQLRLPEIGEEVAAIGYPILPHRRSTLVMHVGVVEALPVPFGLATEQILIQVSFHSGGGLSGGCLIDKRGFVIGIMTQNIYNMPKYNSPINAPKKEELIGKNGVIVGVDSNIEYNKVEVEIPSRPYGQAVPVEYLADKLYEFANSP